MKLAFITPTKFIPKFGNQGDFHLALSHLIDPEVPNEYETNLMASGLPIILDNGTFENGVPEEGETLYKKAFRLKATHVFAPDYLFDREKTQHALHEFIRIREKFIDENPGADRYPKIAAVCQADTLFDYLEFYSELEDTPEVDLIGISIITVPKIMGGGPIDETRYQLLTVMAKAEPSKNAHLLGLGDSYKDVLFAAKHCPWIVSNDTSSCFQNGLYDRPIEGRDLRVKGGKVEHKVDFDLPQGALLSGEDSVIQNNIDTVKYAFKALGSSTNAS